MKKEKRKFFTVLFITFLLLLGIYLAYARYAQKLAGERKKPVAVCGKK